MCAKKCVKIPEKSHNFFKHAKQPVKIMKMHDFSKEGVQIYRFLRKLCKILRGCTTA